MSEKILGTGVGLHKAYNARGFSETAIYGRLACRLASLHADTF